MRSLLTLALLTVLGIAAPAQEFFHKSVLEAHILDQPFLVILCQISVESQNFQVHGLICAFTKRPLSRGFC